MMKVVINNRRSSKAVQFRHQLLSAPVYPEAVPGPLIVNGDEDYATRAFMIFECLVPPGQEGKSFMDVGGDPYTAREAGRRGMRLEPPHDIILLYDLLDHEVAAHPSEMLRRAGEVLADGGLMIVRCHPWCSRHATHLYRKSNKAYLHLLLTDQELAAVGLYNRPTRKDTLPPTKAYREWFAAAGLQVVYEEEVRHPLEPIFSQPNVLEHINIEDKSLLEIQFVDYILSKS